MFSVCSSVSQSSFFRAGRVTGVVFFIFFPILPHLSQILGDLRSNSVSSFNGITSPPAFQANQVIGMTNLLQASRYIHVFGTDGHDNIHNPVYCRNHTVYNA
jgi:hypothetical protein